MQFLWFLIIGGVAGFLAGLVMKGRGMGVLVNIVVGVVGAVLGGFLFDLLDLRAGGTLGSLIVAFCGACVLLALLRVLRKA